MVVNSTTRPFAVTHCRECHFIGREQTVAIAANCLLVHSSLHRQAPYTNRSFVTHNGQNSSVGAMSGVADSPDE
jgi:hypothetical protein